MALSPLGLAGLVRRVGDLGEVGELGGFVSGSDVDALGAGTVAGGFSGAGAGTGAGAGAGAGASAGFNISAEKSMGGGIVVTSSRLCREMVCKPSGERGEAAPDVREKPLGRGGWP